MIDSYKLTKGYLQDTELDDKDWDELIENFKNLVKKETKDFPQDVEEQLFGAIISVFLSWDSNRAKTYRKLNQNPRSLGNCSKYSIYGFW